MFLFQIYNVAIVCVNCLTKKYKPLILIYLNDNNMLKYIKLKLFY